MKWRAQRRGWVGRPQPGPSASKAFSALRCAWCKLWRRLACDVKSSRLFAPVYSVAGYLRFGVWQPGFDFAGTQGFLMQIARHSELWILNYLHWVKARTQARWSISLSKR